MASSPLIICLLFFFITFTRITPSSGQTYKNITRGTTFTPLGPISSWPSPSGDFAFGFFPLPSSSSSSSSSPLFLLGVWFNKTSPHTLVWTPNREEPLQENCTFQFTTDGQLSLKDGNGSTVWNPDFSDASHLALLDSGNLISVFDAATVNPPWQSFGHPTDTLLPGQVMNQESSLLPKLTEADYSDGRFTLRVQGDGNLVFYTLELPTGEQGGAYWASNTVGFGDRLIYNQSGNLFFNLTNGTMSILSTVSTYSSGDFYKRVTLDYDGVLRQYIYPKETDSSTAMSREWNIIADLPPDVCQGIEEDTGSGACGYNSYCNADSSTNQNLINCLCPPSYSFVDPERKYKGCTPNFTLQSCDGDQAADFDLIPITNLDWPRSDYEHFESVSEDQCREYCLQDCFCMVAIFRSGGDCWKKKTPLSNGRMGSNVNRIAWIKVSKSGDRPSSLSPPVRSVVVEKKDRGTLITVGATLLGSSGFLNLILITSIISSFLCFRRSKGFLREKIDTESSASDFISLRTFTYEELERATNGFSEEIGRGSFGAVYKGTLPSNASRIIAVKKIDRLLQETDKEFVAEVRTIGQTHHKNLVKLMGFCNEGTDRLLVYEYMSNGSLTSFLFGGGGRPSWNLRVQIALGIARGLLYLHEECSTPIIHCDIKPQNVLLDDNLAARISDFGLAKLMNNGQTRTMTGIRGTRGYVAPEWFKSTAITKKVDVYSFGVMLLEIVCCRRNLESRVAGGGGEEDDDEVRVLIYWAHDCYREGKLARLVQDDEEAIVDMRRVERFVTVAIWCVQEDPSKRPSMHSVNQMMEEASSDSVTLPPDPSSFTLTQS